MILSDENNMRVFLSVILLSFLIILERFNFEYRWKILAAAIITLEGLSIMILANKIPWYFGFFVSLVAGSYLVKLLITQPRDPDFVSIGNKFMLKLTGQGTLTKWFFPFGFFIIATNILANKFFFNGIIGGSDTVVLIAALSWMSYGYIPSKFSYERDFAFLFTNSLVFILIFPLLIYNFNIFNLNFINSNSEDNQLVEILLTIPLSDLLEILGYDVFAEKNILHFRLLDGTSSRVSIAQGCSGIYSVAIFVSAFFTYVILDYGKLDWQVPLILFIGIQMAYFANLIRMTLIIIVGYYYGLDALNWTHSNIGWIIFIIWIGFFWSLMIRFFEFKKDI